MAINPLFNKATAPIKKNIQKKELTDTTGEVKEKTRKTRSDKKFSVKIPLTLDQRKKIRHLATIQKVYPTNYCTDMIKKGLYRKISFPEIPYPSSSDKSYPVKLEQEYMDMIVAWTIEWDCSRKQAAHRILIGMVNAEGDRHV